MIILIFNSTNVSGYTDDGGIEDGDIVDMEYEGKIKSTGEIFQPIYRSVEPTAITQGSFIKGFYEGIIGMLEGKTSIFEVPPAKGYLTETGNPTDALIGKTLVFTVHIYKIVENIRNDDSSSSNLFSRISTWVSVIGGIILVIFVIIGLNGLRSKTSLAACAHCKSLGRSTKSEGKCSKCGNFYCRASFGRGCPNCKGNSFLPA